MKDANRLTYTGADGITHKGFVNIIQAQRRGFISSEILDTAKYEHIFTRITQAYTTAKRLAENALDEPMRSGIREREYEKVNSEHKQKTGQLDQLYEDAGISETLNIAK